MRLTISSFVFLSIACALYASHGTSHMTTKIKDINRQKLKPMPKKHRLSSLDSVNNVEGDTNRHATTLASIDDEMPSSTTPVGNGMDYRHQTTVRGHSPYTNAINTYFHASIEDLLVPSVSLSENIISKNRQRRQVLDIRDVTSGIVTARRDIVNNVKEVHIAVLLPAEAAFLFSIEKVRPAIEIAMDTVNPRLRQHGVRLVVRYRDSKCNIADGMNEAINFYVHDQVDVMFGPCCDYAAAPCARQMRYWGLPLITAGAMAMDFGLGKVAMYKTMTRIGNTFNSFVEFVSKITEFFEWRKLKIVYNPLGKNYISIKLCHIAANDLHYGLAGRNVSSTYVKFENDREIENKMAEALGRENAGKCRMLVC